MGHETLSDELKASAYMGHRYKLYVPYGKTTVRYNYFSYRVSRIWNALPLDDVDLKSVHRFYNSLIAHVLVRYCKLNFI